MEFCNTVLFKKSVVDMGIKLYNKVPESIKKLANSEICRRELKSLI